jgi:hypothetical protein
MCQGLFVDKRKCLSIDVMVGSGVAGQAAQDRRICGERHPQIAGDSGSRRLLIGPAYAGALLAGSVKPMRGGINRGGRGMMRHLGLVHNRRGDVGRAG